MCFFYAFMLVDIKMICIFDYIRFLYNRKVQIKNIDDDIRK